MHKCRGIEIRKLESIKGGMAEFFTPQTSHETMLVQIPAGAVDDLFVHKTQTDQLLVVRGEFIIVTLVNRKYQYIPLSDRHPAVITIPPGVLHGAINLTNEPCLVVNAVLRHKPTHEKDYIPRPRPYPYDLAAAAAVMEDLRNSSPNIISL
ncbi:dTDP-4-dehydrorhamnose 3,5-epimerase-like enzyme [Calothrix sp. 336/3]|uniref:dTDP-4-dehydrorhamnose 3,5-epimerase-like enzyme n=1 Tax=Calothrix sp. 336/3 TaxID=1337936 RepID=UPI00054F84AC|nr:dTDP-4-dehydrorhamnose 3,5-epimerase-like enzyme [Calothrix sp. 336/3]AKG21974.1 dTDP-4-dehydrorhamnose 3,5-epimerase-like enzyme [Calothrix sp. 336/3]